MMMQVPGNEVMDQTDLSGSLVHKQTTGFMTAISKVCPSSKLFYCTLKKLVPIGIHLFLFLAAELYPSFVSLQCDRKS
jgi:hypothetical protein